MLNFAIQTGLHMKIDAVKDAPNSGPNVSVRKTAYCDTHTPSDSDSKPMLAENSLGETIRKAQSKAVFREKMVYISIYSKNEYDTVDQLENGIFLQL